MTENKIIGIAVALFGGLIFMLAAGTLAGGWLDHRVDMAHIETDRIRLAEIEPVRLANEHERGMLRLANEHERGMIEVESLRDLRMAKIEMLTDATDERLPLLLLGLRE